MISSLVSKWRHLSFLTHRVCGMGANPVSCPSSVVLLLCHGSKSHFVSCGAINRASMESTYRVMTFKQL